MIPHIKDTMDGVFCLFFKKMFLSLKKLFDLFSKFMIYDKIKRINKKGDIYNSRGKCFQT